MKKTRFLLLASLLCTCLLRSACAEAYETSTVDYGQTTATTTMDLIWSFTLNSSGGTTYAVITGVKNANGTANPSGALTVPTSVVYADVGYIVKRIDDGAFANQIGVTAISIPVTVQEIGTGVFAGCTVLSKITVVENNPWFTSVDGVLYDKDRTTLIACPATTESLSLPSSLTSLAASACANCHRLTSVTIPASVTTIGSRAFSGCTLLESLTFKGDAPTADATICDNAEDITIYKESTSTGWDVAPWTSFKDIRNTTAEASSKVMTGFSGQVTWCYRVVDGGAELYNNGDAVIPAGTTQTFSKDPESGEYIGDGTLKLPTSLGGYPVTRIGVRAFTGCAAVTSLDIPSTVTLIDDYAFEKCSGLEEITLPASLTELGTAPFSGSNLAALVLPANLHTLRGNPVAGCLNLDTITVAAKNRYFTSVNNVLYNRKQTRLYGTQSFVESLTVPASVEWVASNAFSCCTLLTNVTFNGNAPVLEDKGFSLYADTDVSLITQATEGTKGWNGDPASSDLPTDKRWPLVGTSRRTIAWTSTPGASEDGTYTEEIAGIKWTFKIENGVAIISKAEQSTSGDVEIPAALKGAPVTTLRNPSNGSIFSDSDKVTGVVIPSTVTNIGDRAFSACSSLAFVDLSAAGNLKTIGDRAFYGCSMLTTLEIPDSCLTIDGSAFSGCTSLTDVILPGKMTSIGSSAFNGCSMLQSVTMPSNLTGIARSAFSGCSALKSIALPADLKTIAQYAFENCSSMKSITIPNSVTTLGAYSFNGCSSLAEVTFEGGIPSGLKNSHLLDKVTNVNCPEPLYDTYKNWLTENGYTCTVNKKGEPEKELKTDGTWYYHIVNDSYAELWCTNGAGNNVCALVNPQTAGKLTLPETLGGYIVKGIAPAAIANLRGITAITVPSAYEWIGNSAFSNDTILASVAMSHGLRSIGRHVFAGSAIETITIPDTVQSIDGNILAGCNPSTAVAVGESNPYFAVSAEGALYDKDLTTLFAVPMLTEEIAIPATVAKFAEECFLNCLRLKKVTFAGSAPTVADGDNLYLDAHAALTNFVAAGSTGFGTVPGTWHKRPVVYAGSAPAEEGTHTEEIAGIKWTFKIENGVAIISKAEQSTSGDVQIPASLKGAPVTTLKYLSTHTIFSDSDKVTGVIIPSTVTNIGDSAFYSCSSLAFADLSAASNLKTIGYHAFYGCSMLTTLEIPDSCLTIDDSAFSGCTSLTDVILPGKMTSLGSSAFSGCSMLQSVTMPSNLTGIARSAFSGCSALKSIALPADLKTIAQYAFDDCASIKSITIPNTVTTLGAYSFNGCSSLAEVTFEGGIPSGLKNSHLLDKVTNVNCPEPLYDTYKNWLTENGYTCTVNKKGEPEKELKTDGTWYYHIVNDSYAELWCTNGAGDNVCALVNPQTVGTLTLPETLGGYIVKGIAANAISDLRGVTAVTIPSTYESIGDFAFSNCTSLAGIEIPYGVRSIGKRAFMNTIIAELTLPDSVINLNGNIAAGALFDLGNALKDSSHFLVTEDGAVYNRDQTRLYACPTRTEGTLTLPNSLTNIGTDAFFGCFRITYLNLPESVANIEGNAFNVSGIWPSLTAPEAEARLMSVFYNGPKPAAADDIYAGAPAGLISYIPSSWGISSGSTWKDRKIQATDGVDKPVLSMTDTDNITWFYRIVDGHAELFNNGQAAIAPKHTSGALYTAAKDDAVFSERGLKIPSSINGYTLRAIGDNAFDGCSGLTVVGIPGTVESIGKSAFANCTALKAVDSDASVPFGVTDGLINLPFGVMTIGAHAFDGTKVLTVNFPTSVKEMDGNPFAGCEFLTTVTVDAANPKFTVVDGILYDKRKTTVVGVPANLDATSVSLPSTVKTIGPEAFLNCIGLDSIVLNDSITSIKGKAFAGCSGVEKITFPATLTDIGSAVFSNCTSLAKVTYLGNAPSAPDDLYDGAPADATSYASSDTEGWSGSTWKERPLIIVSAEDPEDDVLSETDSSGITWRYRVTDGAAEIFATNGTAVSSDAAILALTLPSTLGRYIVKSIGTQAFANLKGLTSIDIPSTYESIGDYAFSNCTSLSSVKLGSGIRTIGKAPFFGSSITSLEIPAGVSTLDGNPGLGAERLAAFTVSADNPDFTAVDGVLYDKEITTLLACPALTTELTLPETVTVLADDAFAGCTRLKTINALGDEPAAVNAIFAETPADLTIRADAYGRQWSEPTASTWKNRSFVNTASGQDGVSTVTDDAGCTWTYTIDGATLTLGAYGATPVIPNTTSGEITVPEKLSNRTVTEIPELAFANCGLLTKITIPAGVTNIAATAFNGCTSLVEIAVTSDNPTFASKYRCLYTKDGKTLVRVPAATRFASTQTQTTIGQKKDIIEILGAIEESTGLLQPNTIVTKKTYGTSTDTLVYAFTPALSAEQILAGVTKIADYAFADCGRIAEGETVSGTLTAKENGKLTSAQTGTFTLPFSTDADNTTESTNVLSTAAGFYQGKVCLYHTATFGTVTYVTDVPLVIPASVTSVAATAFDNAHFTSVSHNVQKPKGALTLTRLGGTSDVYGPLTPGVSVSLDMADFADCSASGLPTGLKWTKTTGILAGIPTKPGTYEITFKQTVKENGRNTTVSRTATIRVADYPVMTLSAAWENAFTGETEALAAGHRLSFYVGVSQQFALTVANDLAGAQNTVTAKGLPAGLKLVKTALKNEKKVVTNYVYTISGTPTKAQVSKPVTLSVSNKYKWTGSLDFEIEILALPNWIAGAYNGIRYDTSSNAFGAASATLSTAGKFSGKFLVPSDDLTSGKSYSFSATSLTAFDAETETFFGTATMKIGKDTFALPFSLVRNSDETGLLELKTPDGFAELVQNIWNRPDLTAPAYTKGTKVTVDGITFKYAAKGVVTWSGKIEDDNGRVMSVSGTSQLLNAHQLLLYVAPKKNLLGGICQLIELP